MKKCPFCGRELLASADFCPFCTSLLKEKTPITFSEKSGASKKLIISCISIALAFCVALFAVGNIKPSDNSNIILPTVSDNADKNTDTNLNGGVSTPPLVSEPDNNKAPTDNVSPNNQKPTDNTDDTTATPQGPSEDKKPKPITAITTNKMVKTVEIIRVVTVVVVLAGVQAVVRVLR